ncbi:MAG: TonB family protein [Bdellovibrionota bacterium]
MQAIIVNNFLWYQSDTCWVTNQKLKLASNGRIVDATILESSGNISFDQATIRAVKKSSPFPSPPATLIPLSNKKPLCLHFAGVSYEMVHRPIYCFLCTASHAKIYIDIDQSSSRAFPIAIVSPRNKKYQRQRPG